MYTLAFVLSGDASASPLEHRLTVIDWVIRKTEANYPLGALSSTLLGQTFNTATSRTT